MSGDELMAPSSPGGSSSGSPLFSSIANDEEMEPSLDEAHSDLVMSAGTGSDLVMSGTSIASCELSSGSAAVSAESLMISDDDAQAGLVGARGWQPGTNCGGFISWTEPLREQSQVLIANVYANMRRLPSAVARSLLSHVGMNLHVRRNFADWCAATFLGVTVNSVRELWAYMGANSWTPMLPDPSEAEGVSASARSRDKLKFPAAVLPAAVSRAQG